MPLADTLGGLVERSVEGGTVTLAVENHGDAAAEVGRFLGRLRVGLREVDEDGDDDVRRPGRRYLQGREFDATDRLARQERTQVLEGQFRLDRHRVADGDLHRFGEFEPFEQFQFDLRTLLQEAFEVVVVPVALAAWPAILGSA